jgi:hypothetical protein
MDHDITIDELRGVLRALWPEIEWPDPKHGVATCGCNPPHRRTF